MRGSVHHRGVGLGVIPVVLRTSAVFRLKDSCSVPPPNRFKLCALLVRRIGLSGTELRCPYQLIYGYPHSSHLAGTLSLSPLNWPNGQDIGSEGLPPRFET
ncbi:hypothetical protein AAC387_Pa07g3206 [Persea americana]